MELASGLRTNSVGETGQVRVCVGAATIVAIGIVDGLRVWYILFPVLINLFMDNLEKGDFALKLRDGEVEVHGGRPVCTLECAAGLIAEFDRLFPGSNFEFMGDEFVKRDGEKRFCENAFKVVERAVLDSKGLSPDVEFCELDDGLCDEIRELIHYGRGRNRPNIFNECAKPGFSRAALLASIDDSSDPFGKLFMETVLDDVRVDVSRLLGRMAHYMDSRDLFPRLYVGETEAMRGDFRALINGLLAGLGLPEADPAFKGVCFSHVDGDGLCA